MTRQVRCDCCNDFKFVVDYDSDGNILSLICNKCHRIKIYSLAPLPAYPKPKWLTECERDHKHIKLGNVEYPVEKFSITWDNHLEDISGMPGLQTISFEFISKGRRYYGSNLIKNEMDGKSKWGVEEI